MHQISAAGAQGTITADNDPFSTVETYHAESRFYKGGTINTYHRFEAPKGGTEKSIIFHALGDMDKRGGYKGESSSSTSCGMSEIQCSAEAKLIREGMGKDFRRAKNREGIPPFEAMLSPEQRRALYSGTEMRKDPKRLGN